MQNLHLHEFLAEAIRCQVHHYQCLAVPVEPAVMVNFPVHSGWNNRAVGIAGVCDCVKVCVSFIM